VLLIGGLHGQPLRGRTRAGLVARIGNERVFESVGAPATTTTARN
jgi:hypothetical protein